MKIARIENFILGTGSSKDLLFTFDIIAAGVKASPANWARLQRGFCASDRSASCLRAQPAIPCRLC